MAEGIITLRDIIEEDALNWGEVYKKNVQIAIESNNKLKENAKQTLSVFKDLQKGGGVKELAQAQKKIINEANQAGKAYEARGKALLKVDEERRRGLKNLLTVTNRLQNVQTSTNKQLIEKRELLRRENQEIKKNLTFMGRLELARLKALRTVEELNAKRALGFKLSDKEQAELKQSTDAYNKYHESFKVIKRSTQQFQDNVGNYPKQFRIIGASIKSLIPVLGLVGGIRFGIEFLRDARQFAIEARGVEFAFERIGAKGESALEKVRASTRGLLSELDIKKAVVEFDNFGLDLEEIDTLLEFVAVRASQTGKSFDNLRDSLVEGLSKQSKLRIDNLGISTKELNDQLKETPDFVQAVATIAKREVAEAGDILDRAGNAQQRWNASYENFQLQIGKGLISRASNAMYNFGSALLDAITPAKTLTKEIKNEQVELNVLVNRITDVNTKNEERERMITTLRDKYPSFLKFLKDEKTDNESLSVALQEINQQYIKRIALQTQQERIQKVLDKAGKNAFRTAKNQVDIERELADINATTLKGALDFANKSLEEKIELTKEALRENAKFSENQRTGTVSAINEEAKALSRLNSLGVDRFVVNRRGSELNEELIEEQEEMRALEIALGGTLEQINALFAENNALKDENADKTDELTDAEKRALAQRRKQLEEDSFNLDKARIQQNIDNEKRILEDSSKVLGDRLLAVKTFSDQRIELLKLQRDRDLELAKGRVDEQERIELQYSQDLAQIERDRNDESAKIIQQGIEQAKQRIDERKEIEVNILNLKIQALQETLQKELEAEGVTNERKKELIQAFEEDVSELKRKSAEDQITAQIAVIDAELAVAKLSYEQQVALNLQLTALKKALGDVQTANALKSAQDQIKIEEELNQFRSDKIREASATIADALNLDAGNLEALFKGAVDGFDSVLEGLSASFAVLGDISASIFGNNLDQIDAQLQATEEFYDRQYELAEGDQIQQDLIRQEQEKKRQDLEKKKRREQARQAKFQKALSVAQIGFNTAQAILGIWAEVPKFDFGISAGALTAFVSALGAIQIASVLAKPIPKYAEGVKNHPGGWALVAEERPEVIKEPGKKPYIQHKPGILNLKTGTEVVPSLQEYENQVLKATIMTSFALQDKKLSGSRSEETYDKYHQQMLGKMDENTKAVKDLKLSVKINNKASDIPHAIYRGDQLNW